MDGFIPFSKKISINPKFKNERNKREQTQREKLAPNRPSSGDNDTSIHRVAKRTASPLLGRKTRLRSEQYRK